MSDSPQDVDYVEDHEGRGYSHPHSSSHDDHPHDRDYYRANDQNDEDDTERDDERGRVASHEARGASGAGEVGLNEEMPGNVTLFVTRFRPPSDTEEAFRAHFGQFGEILKVLLLGKTAFIQFASEQAAVAAKEGAHYQPGLDSDSLIVDFKKGQIKPRGEKRTRDGDRRRSNNDRPPMDYRRGPPPSERYPPRDYPSRGGYAQTSRGSVGAAGGYPNQYGPRGPPPSERIFPARDDYGAPVSKGYGSRRDYMPVREKERDYVPRGNREYMAPPNLDSPPDFSMSVRNFPPRDEFSNPPRDYVPRSNNSRSFGGPRGGFPEDMPPSRGERSFPPVSHDMGGFSAPPRDFYPPREYPVARGPAGGYPPRGFRGPPNDFGPPPQLRGPQGFDNDQMGKRPRHY